jgi:hypothetical protein
MRQCSWKTALGLIALATVLGGSAWGEEPSAPDSAMFLPGGSEGATLQDITIQGEDKIRIEFERPALDLTLDPHEAPGLDWDQRQDVLGRTDISFDRPVLDVSAFRVSPFLGCAWSSRFATAPVARFHPAVEKVERWTLTVANSRGEMVAEFRGKDKVPEEIFWDGLTADGTPALPGLMYSYVFEAYDRAGNKRNIMGEGFELPPYRLNTERELSLLFSATDLGSMQPTTTPNGLIVEAAMWINQTGRGDWPVQVKATARSYERARALADAVVHGLEGRVLGDPRRLMPLTLVEPNAPADGAVTIHVGAVESR